VSTTVTMKELLESGIHFGHQTRRWNPKMSRYIYGERHGVYIIDLQKTIRQLQRAYRLVRETAAQGGNVLFVGTKKQSREPIQQQAERCGQYYVNNRWLGGTLTNWATIQNSVRSLAKLVESEETGKIAQFTKREQTMLRRDRERLEKNLSGIKTMTELPKLLFVIDAQREEIAVREARRIKIPCVAICDTNSDPETVDVPIPGNDDAIRAITLFCTIMADAVIEGRTRFEKDQEDTAQRAASDAAKAVKSAKLKRQATKGAEEESGPAAPDEQSPSAPESGPPDQF
jgi:small subunit ribosomal protein S2